MYATRGVESCPSTGNYYQPLAVTSRDSSMINGGTPAGVFSRDDYSQWKTHAGQFSFTNTRDYQSDGKGRRHKDANRKTSAPSPPHYVAMGNGRPRGGEMLVPGAKLPLRSAMSHEPVKHRRDEMVTPTARIHSNRRLYQRSLSQTPTTNDYIQSQQHMSRAQQYEHMMANETHVIGERKRSVSPQMERKPNPRIINTRPPQILEEKPSLNMGVVSKKKSAQKRVKIKINLESQEVRLSTFKLHPIWPKPHLLSPALLSSYGFYYTGQEDIVQCFSCCVKISDWNERDDPLVRHFEESPNCVFLRSEFHESIEEFCFRSDKFNYFIDFVNRQRSFNYWPIPRQVNVTDLINGGWFYTGKDVITQCYTCGCRYDEWRKGDDPITIHKQLSVKCSFIKQYTTASCIDFSNYESRVQSFKLIPSDCPLSKEELAGAGFHLFSTQPMRVKCWSCDLKIESEWVKGDDPLRIHKLMRPSCKAITSSRQQEEENIESFPGPFMSQSQLVKKFSHQKPSSLPHVNKTTPTDEFTSNSMDSTSVFNAPIYLPPGLKRKQDEELSVNYKESSLSPSHSLSSSEEDKLCVVCLDNTKQYAIVPCGHLCVCHSCSLQLVFCPICRIEKEDALRIFDS